MRYSYGLAIIILTLAACARENLTPLPASQAAMTAASTVNAIGYKQLYSFKGIPDGSYPMKRLLNVAGVLYGTANWGGEPTRGRSGEETGTVFKWSATDGERTIHVFQDYPDGRNPVAGLINVMGELYGTTEYGGGLRHWGTLFKISPSGNESVLYRFNGPRDGFDPIGGLIYVNGLFYGTTYWGGLSGCPAGCGTVYSVTRSGSHKVLYRFKGGTDGFAPVDNLVYKNGMFYGTTTGDYENNGTVFQISPSGRERVLHDFRGQPDGANPGSGLLDVNGEFYGTTSAGGTQSGGVIYRINDSGKESVVYNFPHGSVPQSGLIYVNGWLYGTTNNGGGGDPGSGTIFRANTSGKGAILYGFKGGSDGKNPMGGLIYVNGALYGTTSGGGAYGMGTLFRISP